MALNQVGLERLGTSVTNKIGENKNIIINGAMTVQQQMNAQTTGGQNLTGIKTVDRFGLDFSGTDNSPTQIPVDVAAGTTPYTSGFRRCFKIINGNQTSGAGTADRIVVEYKIESQDIANSGWNYLSSSSYITFSYWVKSSVAQNFYNTFKNDDGTSQRYVTETGSLSADTWTKITKTISGNSNLTFNNDNGEGLEITWELFRGTDQTGTRPLNAWAAADNATRTPDQTSTWYTTNDATFEITGVQLEVSDHATSFEFRSYGQELALCQRYCYADRGSEDYHAVAQGHFNGSTTGITMLYTPVCMRAAPTLSYPVGTWIVSGDAGTLNQSNIYPTDNIGGVNAFQIRAAVSGAQSGEGFLLRTSSAGHTWILDAEL